jgi:hypothetical protein
MPKRGHGPTTIIEGNPNYLDQGFLLRSMAINVDVAVR